MYIYIYMLLFVCIANNPPGARRGTPGGFLCLRIIAIIIIIIIIAIAIINDSRCYTTSYD